MTALHWPTRRQARVKRPLNRRHKLTTPFKPNRKDGSHYRAGEGARCCKRLGGVTMLIETGSKQRMPIRLPGPDLLRRRIAEIAAELSAMSVDHYLERLGPVEPVFSSSDEGVPWRLSASHGSYAELDLIDQAVQTVQRLHPLMKE